jgi:pPIWI_RE three-gene island domain Y/REase associating with pPIWI_RE
MPRLTATADLSFFTGEPLLRMIATALVELSRRATPGDPVYSDNVQSAYNHVVLACLLRGEQPPASVPGLVQWAGDKPLRSWPLDLPEEYLAPGLRLVDADTRTPTQICLELAVPATDAASEQFENLLMEEALDTSRSARSPETYTAFRRLLISSPALSGIQLAQLAGDLDLAPLYEVIKRCYEPASAAYVREGKFVTCSRCGCLLIPIKPAGYRCELDRCRRDGRPAVGRVYGENELGGLLQLTRPLRMFITGPGLAETDLEQDLAVLGLNAEMWPNFDAYDLRITFQDGRVWAIDVKDRVNPALLGRGAKGLRPDPPYDRAFLVVPGYRFEEREDYGRVFDSHRPDELKGHLDLVTDMELLRLAGRTLRQIERGAKQNQRATGSGPNPKEHGNA